MAPSSTNKASHNIRLNFNHPVKYIAFNFNGGSSAALGWYSGNVANVGHSTETASLLYQAKLQLNGHDRFGLRAGSYFNRVQPFQTIGSAPNAGVYMYSFALRPDEHQPSNPGGSKRSVKMSLVLSLEKGDTVKLPEQRIDAGVLFQQKVTIPRRAPIGSQTPIRLVLGSAVQRVDGGGLNQSLRWTLIPPARDGTFGTASVQFVQCAVQNFVRRYVQFQPHRQCDAQYHAACGERCDRCGGQERGLHHQRQPAAHQPQRVRCQLQCRRMHRKVRCICNLGTGR